LRDVFGKSILLNEFKMFIMNILSRIHEIISIYLDSPGQTSIYSVPQCSIVIFGSQKEAAHQEAQHISRF
jgi:hypothetical protein